MPDILPITLRAWGPAWAAQVPIGPDAGLDPRFGADFTVDAHRVHLVIEVIDERPVPVSVTVEAQETKTPVTPAVLRDVGRLLDRVTEAAALERLMQRTDVQPDGWSEWVRPAGPEQVEQLLDRTRTRRRVTRAVLEEVATVWAESGGSVGAVKAHFFVSEPTAYRYVRQARDAGLMPEDDE
jgi:hypothetical protein